MQGKIEYLDVEEKNGVMVATFAYYPPPPPRTVKLTVTIAKEDEVKVEVLDEETGRVHYP